jgi:hypothetical protein
VAVSGVATYLIKCSIPAELRALGCSCRLFLCLQVIAFNVNLDAPCTDALFDTVVRATLGARHRISHLAGFWVDECVVGEVVYLNNGLARCWLT